jgi:hypothetical protein
MVPLFMLVLLVVLGERSIASGHRRALAEEQGGQGSTHKHPQGNPEDFVIVMPSCVAFLDLVHASR